MCFQSKFQEKQHLVVDLAEFTNRAKEVGKALTASRREAASAAAARDRDPLQDEIEEVVASSRS